MVDFIEISDCFGHKVEIKIDSILDFDIYTKGSKPITIIKLKEKLENGINKDFKTYESGNSIRLRYSKIYDELHKED